MKIRLVIAVSNPFSFPVKVFAMGYVQAGLYHGINIGSSDLLLQNCFSALYCISHSSASGCPSHMEHRGDSICYLMIWKVNTSRAVL